MLHKCFEHHEVKPYDKCHYLSEPKGAMFFHMRRAKNQSLVAVLSCVLHSSQI